MVAMRAISGSTRTGLLAANAIKIRSLFHQNAARFFGVSEIFLRLGIVHEFASVSFIGGEVFETDQGHCDVVRFAESFFRKEIAEWFAAAAFDDFAFTPAACIGLEVAELMRVNGIADTVIDPVSKLPLKEWRTIQ
jgi:hypothetical protein